MNRSQRSTISSFLYENLAIIDTSAVLALHDNNDSLHREAVTFFNDHVHMTWFVLNETTHESFTRSRYKFGLDAGLQSYEFLRASPFQLLNFSDNDELRAEELIRKYNDQRLSFHDALCASVMIREGIFQIFTFDSDFWCFGFSVLPGITIK